MLAVIVQGQSDPDPANVREKQELTLTQPWKWEFLPFLSSPYSQLEPNCFLFRSSIWIPQWLKCLSLLVLAKLSCIWTRGCSCGWTPRNAAAPELQHEAHQWFSAGEKTKILLCLKCATRFVMEWSEEKPTHIHHWSCLLNTALNVYFKTMLITIL